MNALSSTLCINIGIVVAALPTLIIVGFGVPIAVLWIIVANSDMG